MSTVSKGQFQDMLFPLPREVIFNVLLNLCEQDGKALIMLVRTAKKAIKQIPWDSLLPNAKRLGFFPNLTLPTKKLDAIEWRNHFVRSSFAPGSSYLPESFLGRACSRSALKVSIYGGGGVGKSSCLKQFVQGYITDDYNPTNEDTFRKLIMVDKQIVDFEVFDTTGEEEYSCRPDIDMRRSDAFILLYSITSRTSFEEVQRFMDQIERVKDVHLSQIPSVLVGNKCDLEDNRQVATSEGIEWGKRNKIAFFESSALWNKNIYDMFAHLARLENQPEPLVNPPKKRVKPCLLQ